MKYKSEKSLRRAKKAFSLIELMIVIVIIGALTAIILPQFDVSEAEAKDTGCDASNYGTLSQLTKFRSLNGAYPARMHTGYEAASNGGASTDALMGTTDSVFAKIPSFTALNMASGDSASATARSTSFNVNDGDYLDFGDSLREAGIISLACGGFPIDAASSGTAYVAFNGIKGNTSMTANAVYLSAITSDWFEAWAVNDDGTANDAELDTASTPITINGIPLPYYMFEDPRTEYAKET
ncbi:MAG: prepilin-type N-terminal cleavage/methylation domain-containing protein, partial [Opitutales bacterium]